jgi:hypothetical protein
MARGVTERQRQLLILLDQSLRVRGEAPTLRELGEAMGGVTA